MGQKIWGTLADYEGKWVAVDRNGRVVAHAATLPELMKSEGVAATNLTLLYAAEGAREDTEVPA